MNEKICPKCYYPQMKSWEELTDDQKFFAEKLPLNTDFSLEQRKKHRFCERCWFEDFVNIFKVWVVYQMI